MTVDKQQLRAAASEASMLVEDIDGEWVEHVLDLRIDGERLPSEFAAFIAAASPSTVLALLGESAEVLAERDAMQSMLTQTMRERERLHDTLKAVVDVCIDKGGLRVMECVGEDAPPKAVAKLVEQRDAARAEWQGADGAAAAYKAERDAAIARAETILGDRDLGIRRIAELTARAEKAERERDELRASWHAEFAVGAEYQRLWATETQRVEKAERDTAEAIAVWLDEVIEEREDNGLSTKVIRDVADAIRAGAWRKP